MVPRTLRALLLSLPGRFPRRYWRVAYALRFLQSVGRIFSKSNSQNGIRRENSFLLTEST
jgi:hypothetical protein